MREKNPLTSNIYSVVGVGSLKAARSRAQLRKQPGMLKALSLTDRQHLTHTSPGTTVRGVLLFLPW